MQTDSAAMKGGANSLPASWEAVDEGAAAGLALNRLAQAKLPFQVPPSLVPQQGSGGDTAQWQILRELRAAAPDQGTMTIPPMTEKLFNEFEVQISTSAIEAIRKLENRSLSMLDPGVKSSGASIYQLLDRALSGRLAKTDQENDPHYKYSPLIMVLKEWFKHSVHHLQVGELGPNQTADACRRLVEALANLFRQICTRPRAATGGIEDVVGEILRGGCRYSGFLFTSPYHRLPVIPKETCR
jgi:hypothetical protein